MRIALGLCICTLLSFAPLVRAQLVAGADQTSNNASIWLIDVNNPGSPQQLLGPSNAAVTWGMAADDANSTLYWNNGTQLSKATYTPGSLGAPMSVGAITLIGVGTQTVSSMTGMAFQGGSLYGYKSTTSGTFPAGFYRIDPTTAQATLEFGTPTGTDFGGFDFDPGTNAFYGTNDGTGGPGRGLVRIDDFFGTPSFTLLAPYPGADTDVDGLAVGNGRAYMVNDNSTANQGIYVFNLTTMMYETTIPNPFSNTSAIFAGGAWVPGLIPEPSAGMMIFAIAAARLLGRRRRIAG